MLTITLLVLAAVVIPLGCGHRPDTKDNRAAASESLAAVNVDASVVSDGSGDAIGRVQVANAYTQIVRAAASSRIAGSLVAFPPGAFDIDANVTIAEGVNIATSSNLVQLIDSGIVVQAVAPAVEVTFSSDENTLLPFLEKIPLPLGGVKPGQSLVVLYLKNTPGAAGLSLGLLAASDLVVDGGWATFSSRSYGISQAVYLASMSASPVKPKQVVTQQKILPVASPSPPSPAAQVAPSAFSITGPTDPLTGGQPTILWDFANSADSYELRLDNKDPACGSPYRIYPGLLANGQVADKVQDGINFVCVAAINSAGRTLATNSGFKFVADASPPPVPSSPVSDSGATTSQIAITFHWSAVTDVGPAGLSGYTLQVGTTPGGEDIFNGTIPSTSKQIVGFDGLTYYARVSAVDAVGNASAWSANSAGVTIHASH